MEGTIGEIRIFAASFAPHSWAFCQGQQVNIQSNTALFAILGTYYGGNGSTTFNLPNLGSRAIVGAGQGPGLSEYVIGDQAGAETVTILSQTMPAHIHQVQATAAPGASGTAVINAVNGVSGEANPGGNFIGGDTGGGLQSYAASGTTVAMATGSIQVSNVTGPKVTGVTLTPSGGSQPHANIQPYLALNYIICVQGTFPVRD
jgi:microcystin-dependent protein